MTQMRVIPFVLLRKVTLSQKTLKKFTHSAVDIFEENGVRRITMADEKTRNSMSINMVSSLLEAIQKNESDKTLRCIVISGKGPVFSAGHNLKELSSPGGRKVFDDYSQLMLAMVRCPVPVIAAVDGLAAAAGCQLVAQADIAICTTKSTFSTPGASFGVFCSTPGIPVVRSVGRKKAGYMLFTGLPLTAAEAYAAGLVSTVAQDGQLEHDLKKITDAIKSKSRSVLELGKGFFYKQMEMDLESAYQKGSETMLDNLDLVDGKEGLKSFSEKRKPSWLH